MSDEQQFNRRLTRIKDQIDAILKLIPAKLAEKSSTTK